MDEDDPSRLTELAWQGQGGHAGPVNEHIVRWIPRMRRLLNIRIPPSQRSRIDPDDVLQQTLIVATRRLDELEVRSPASILQWLSRIAALEIKRRLESPSSAARDLGMRSDPGSDDLVGVVVPSEDPPSFQSLARSEMEELIDRHLQRLEPADYREVILLRDYYEADWESIRSQLGRPTVEAVQDLYHRAQKRLRERIAKYLA